MKLAWGARVPEEFRRRAIAIAVELACDPSDLMACMYFESRLDPAARNAQSGATGLIQFMPEGSIKELGTTPEALAAMSGVEQLEYVRRYFVERGYAGKVGTLDDLYMAILWPAAIGKSDDFVLMREGGKAYLQNRGLDVNADGTITKYEASAYVRNALAQGLREGNVYVDDAPIEGHSTEEKGMGAGLLMGLIQAVVSGFAPQVAQQFNSTLEKNGATSDTGAKLIGMVANSIAPNFLTLPPAEQIKAAAAVTPAQVKAAELDVQSYLSAIAPMLDKVAQYELQIMTANSASADAAGERGRKDAVDLGPYILTYIGLTCALSLIFLFALMGVQAWFNEDHEPSTAMLTLVAGILGGIFGSLGTIVAYRFGEKRSSSAALVAQDSINTLTKKVNA